MFYRYFALLPATMAVSCYAEGIGNPKNGYLSAMVHVLALLI
jgi:hypothetical protein